MLTEEEIEKQLSELSAPEIDSLVNNLRRIALFVGKTELQKTLARKLDRFSKRLAHIEQWQQKPASVRKSVVGQDDEGEPDDWPSLDKLFGD